MSINSLEDQRLKGLQDLAAVGDVDKLFLELTKDLYVLEDIEKIPLVTTPLHTAASKGKIRFAKEIVNLKPSFAWKRDERGRSPLHLALEGKHEQEGQHMQEGQDSRNPDLERGDYQELITWLIKHDSGLVRVKARGLITPLHYAAQVDDESSLDEFLHVFPSSIEDLTVKSETAVHVAIKNGSFKAFEVLLGWLSRVNKLEILNRKDEEGNNALHTAVSASKPEMVKLLLPYMEYMEVNERNSNGLTALEMFNDYQRQGLLGAEVGAIRRATEAITASQLHSPSQESSLGEKFSQKIRFISGLGNRGVNEIPLETRNILLVVAVLVATATYQAALSPPGGFWQDNSNPQPAANNASTEPSEHHAGKMILRSRGQSIFLAANSISFFTSLCMISALAVGLPFENISLFMIGWMSISYYCSILATLNFTKWSLAKNLHTTYLVVGVLAASVFNRLVREP